MPFPMTLDDLEGHSPNAGLTRCNSTNICATFSASRYPSATANFLVDPVSDNEEQGGSENAALSHARCHFKTY